MSMTAGTIDRQHVDTRGPLDQNAKQDAETYAKRCVDAMIKNVDRDPQFHIVQQLKMARDAQSSPHANYLLDKFKAGHNIINEIPTEARQHFQQLQNVLGVAGTSGSDWSGGGGERPGGRGY